MCDTRPQAAEREMALAVRPAPPEPRGSLQAVQRVRGPYDDSRRPSTYSARSLAAASPTTSARRYLSSGSTSRAKATRFQRRAAQGPARAGSQREQHHRILDAETPGTARDGASSLASTLSPRPVASSQSMTSSRSNCSTLGQSPLGREGACWSRPPVGDRLTGDPRDASDVGHRDERLHLPPPFVLVNDRSGMGETLTMECLDVLCSNV